MAAHVAVYPPPIASTGFDDDQPLMVTSGPHPLHLCAILANPIARSLIETIDISC